MIKHTFAVLAYKDSAFIGDCIDSLLAQTVKSRICITTSTPSDYLRRIAEKYGLPMHTNTGRGGIADDWSFAYSQCETDYVTLAHQDDLYMSDYTALSLEKSDRSNDNLITFTDSRQLQNGTAYTWKLNLAIKRMLLFPFILRGTWRNRTVRQLVLRFGNSICCPSVMYHKRKIDEFRFSEEYTYNLDWDAWIRLSTMDGSFSYIGTPLVLHRIHQEGQTYVQTKSNRRAEEELKCLKRLMPAPIASIYGKLYALGSLSNKVKQ